MGNRGSKSVVHFSFLVLNILFLFYAFLEGNSPDFTPILFLAVTPVIPVKVYDNADTQKESMIDDNRRKAGIYR